jgi:hypothetical protein
LNDGDWAVFTLREDATAADYKECDGKRGKFRCIILSVDVADSNVAENKGRRKLFVSSYVNNWRWFRKKIGYYVERKGKVPRYLNQTTDEWYPTPEEKAEDQFGKQVTTIADARKIALRLIWANEREFNDAVVWTNEVLASDRELNPSVEKWFPGCAFAREEAKVSLVAWLLMYGKKRYGASFRPRPISLETFLELTGGNCGLLIEDPNDRIKAMYETLRDAKKLRQVNPKVTADAIARMTCMAHVVSVYGLLFSYTVRNSMFMDDPEACSKWIHRIGSMHFVDDKTPGFAQMREMFPELARKVENLENKHSE